MTYDYIQILMFNARFKLASLKRRIQASMAKWFKDNCHDKLTLKLIMFITHTISKNVLKCWAINDCLKYMYSSVLTRAAVTKTLEPTATKWSSSLQMVALIMQKMFSRNTTGLTKVYGIFQCSGTKPQDIGIPGDSLSSRSNRRSVY